LLLYAGDQDGKDPDMLTTQRALAALLSPALLSLAACHAGPAPHTAATPPAASDTIAISVGPCFGFCPVYTVTVTPGGTITFEGERHTAVLGKRSREGGPASYQALAAALAHDRPATGTQAQTTCEQRISDQVHYDITWTAPDGTVTRLGHDRGCRSAANEALGAALQAMPDQLGIAPWAHQLTRPGASRG
jgi:hypothetical protein